MKKKLLIGISILALVLSLTGCAELLSAALGLRMGFVAPPEWMIGTWQSTTSNRSLLVQRDNVILKEGSSTLINFLEKGRSLEDFGSVYVSDDEFQIGLVVDGETEYYIFTKDADGQQLRYRTPTSTYSESFKKR